MMSSLCLQKVRTVRSGLRLGLDFLDSMLGGLATFFFIDIYIYIRKREKGPNLTHLPNPIDITCS